MLADWACVGNVLFLILNIASGRAAETTFLGRDSCSSSGCHGGAGARQNQSLIWSRLDPHARASATLTSARSTRIAQVLKISDATKDRSCTSCHSPWQGLAAELLPAGGEAFNVHAEAVSCETCHGAAANWIRSHTRPDLTRADKVLDGLRDLTKFYNRANACVACHQVLDPKLLAAGHPELIFELDGQTSAMPRHWVEKDEQHRQKGWLTGQAAALREVTAQIAEQGKTGEIAAQTLSQWQALLWIVSRALPDHKISKFEKNIATTTNSLPSGDRLREFHQMADALAIEASVQVRDESITILRRLAATSSEFLNATGDSVVPAIRAERLVLALDRLSHTLPATARKNLDESLRVLFALVQSRPDFNAKEFARSLEQFKTLLDNVGKSAP